MSSEKRHIYVKRSLHFLITLLIVIGVVFAIRQYVVCSFRISTPAMEEAVSAGDYVLVNRLPKDNPGRNRAVVFQSPVLPDTVPPPLLISRCVGMPGDTVSVQNGKYNVNRQPTAAAARLPETYRVSNEVRSLFFETMGKLKFPLRHLEEDSAHCTLLLLPKEAAALRKLFSSRTDSLFTPVSGETYTFTVPRKGRTYRLDSLNLPACRGAILAEAGAKATFRNGKLFLDGRETVFFTFSRDYYWLISDNPTESVDSRHLGFIPKDHIIGNVWLCWFSCSGSRFLKPIR